MTDRGQIASRVRRLLSQVLDEPEETIGPAITVETSPSWTSLNHLMLVSQLENEFGVVFSNQEIRELTSYDRIVEMVARRLGSQG